MNKDRIEMLEQFLKEDNSDPFNHYALALEYKDLKPEKAKSLFEHLLVTHPDYLPTYYIAGLFYSDQSENAKGLLILRKGLELARSQKNHSASRELQAAIQQIED
mgnify:CR=1 FL=1